MNRDRVKYAKVESKDLRTIQLFLEQNQTKLETAELSVRSSAGTYMAELRPTNEPSS